MWTAMCLPCQPGCVKGVRDVKGRVALHCGCVLHAHPVPRAEEVISEKLLRDFFPLWDWEMAVLCMCTGQTQKVCLAFVKCSYPELLYDSEFLDMACTCPNKTLRSTVLACLRDKYQHGFYKDYSCAMQLTKFTWELR